MIDDGPSDNQRRPMGNKMIRLLAHIRNVLVIVILSWLGFSESPNDNQRQEDNKPAPTSSMLLLR